MNAMQQQAPPGAVTDIRWPNLIRDAREVMDGTDEERIAFLKKPRWIGYPAARQALGDLQALLDHPRVNRPPCRLILGATNNGKTDILRKFEKDHPRVERADGEGLHIPVVYVICPSGPDEKGFYENILRALGVPFSVTGSTRQRFTQVLRVATEVGLRMLMLDEIHNVLAGSSAKHRGFLNTLKLLSGELQIPIVTAGTKAAFHAMGTEQEVSNRFEPIPLPPWQMGDEFLSLLASFERVIPLRLPSNLANLPLATKILAKSEGHIGEIARLLAAAAKLAITSNLELISAQVLDAAEYRSPSERRELPDGLD